MEESGEHILHMLLLPCALLNVHPASSPSMRSKSGILPQYKPGLRDESDLSRPPSLIANFKMVALLFSLVVASLLCRSLFAAPAQSISSASLPVDVRSDRDPHSVGSIFSESVSNQA